MPPIEPQRQRRPQNLQQRLEAIIGAQTVQIAAMQSQIEELQIELERLKKPEESKE